MAPKREVSIVLKAVDEASKVFENVSNNALPQFAKRVAQLATTFASVGAAEEILRHSIDAYLESEKVANQLAGALRAQGLATDALLPKLLAQAEALSKVSTASDEAIASAQQILISVGGLLGPKLTQATKAALDLSAGLGIDLQEAALRVAKAAEGSVKEFSRLGVQFKANASDAEKLDAVLEFIQRRFGGMAANELQSVAGATAQATKAFHELEETLGKVLVTSVGGVETFTRLTIVLQQLNTELQSGSIQNFFKALVSGFSAAGAAGPSGVLGAVALSVAKLKSDATEAAKAATDLNDALSPADAAAHAWLKIDADWAKQIEQNASAAAKQVEVLQRIIQNIETQTFGPQVEGKKTPIKGGGSDFAIAHSFSESDLTAVSDANDKIKAQAEQWAAMVKIIDDAKDGLLKYGETIDFVATKWEVFAADMEASLTGSLAQAAAQLGGILVDAAFGAEVSWDKAIASIIEGLIKAVVQAYILKLVETAFLSGGGVASSSGIGPHAYQSGGLVYAAGGLFTPRGTDVVPAMLTPGEAVLNRGVTKAILGGRASLVPTGRGAGSPQLVTVKLGGATLTRLLVDNARSVVEVLDHIDARGL
jgi:hypothetical protein